MDPGKWQETLKIRSIRGVAAHQNDTGTALPFHFVYGTVDEPPLYLRLVRWIHQDVISFPRVLHLETVILFIVALFRGDVRPEV